MQVFGVQISHPMRKVQKCINWFVEIYSYPCGGAATSFACRAHTRTSLQPTLFLCLQCPIQYCCAIRYCLPPGVY